MNRVFNYNHFYYFYVTATAGGISKAAQRLRTSQPSLSIQLKTLEQNLERPLFRKRGRRLVLTPDGERVYQYCRSAFSNFENLSQFLRNSRLDPGVRIHLGVSDEIERPFVTDVAALALRKLAGSKLHNFRLLSQSHDLLGMSLASGDLDVLLTNRSLHLPDARLLAEYRLPVALIGSRQVLGRGPPKSVAPAAFLRQSDLGLSTVSRDQLFRLEVEAFLSRHGLQKRIAFESNVFAAITRSVSAGLAVGFVPTPYVQNDIESDRLIVIGSAQLWYHKLYLYGREGGFNEDWVEMFSSAIVRQGGARSDTSKK